MDLGRTALRGIIGALFVGHGTQKLFGWFGGHGLEGTAGFFETLGLRPGARHAKAAGASEAVGGALIALGALTPLGAAMISGSMITAIRKAHLSNGPWVTNGGYEYNLVLLGAMLAITESGPGRPSVDDALFPRLRGTGWALAQLAAAGAGSYLATEHFSEPAPEAAPAPREGEQELPGDPAAPRESRFQREPAETPTSTGA
jgi:putative oxidoreductase